jgi:hypothetical protein
MIEEGFVSLSRKTFRNGRGKVMKLWKSIEMSLVNKFFSSMLRQFAEVIVNGGITWEKE